MKNYVGCRVPVPLIAYNGVKAGHIIQIVGIDSATRKKEK
jgi:hypothetical protein